MADVSMPREKVCIDLFLLCTFPGKYGISFVFIANQQTLIVVIFLAPTLVFLRITSARKHDTSCYTFSKMLVYGDDTTLMMIFRSLSI